MKNNFINLFLIFGSNILFLPFTFFSINSIFGIEYTGTENSSSYIYSIIISFFLSIIFSLILLFKQKKTYKTYFLLLVPCVFFLLCLFVFLFNDFDFSKFFFQYFLLVFPCFVFGIVLSRDLCLKNLSLHFLIISIINTLSILILIPKIILIPTVELITFYGGGQYQAFSYASSISFLVTLVYFLFYEKNYSRFKYFYFFLLFIQFLGILLSGGRGGVFVVLLGSFIIIKSFFPFKKLLIIGLKLSLFLIVSVFISLLLFKDYMDRFFESYNRLFSFLSKNGIDMEQTSNRDIVYSESINLILKKPFLGYGMFNYRNFTDGAYPHNLMLEILLQGGVLYLFFCLFGLYFLFGKCKKLLKDGNSHKFLYATMTYSFVMLMFSGTYLLEPFLWFNISYIVGINIKHKTVVKYSI